MKDEYISKEQFCKECHVGKRTALWLIQSGLLPAINTMRQTGRYLIAKSDVIRYLNQRELAPEKYRYKKHRCRGRHDSVFSLDEPADSLRNSFEKLWSNVPDVLRCHEVQALLGYEESVIARWRKEFGLKYIKASQTIYYPKKYLIDFLLSPQSLVQHPKSTEHIQLMRRIENAEK